MALLVGTALTLLIAVLYYGVFPTGKHDFWPHYLMISFYLFLIISAMTYLVSVLDVKGRKQDQNKLEYGILPKPGKKVWLAWILLIVLMVGLYILFNGH